MPSQLVEISDVDQTVTRPVIMGIMDQVFDITKLSKDTSIYYSRLNGPHQSAGSSIDTVGQKEAKFMQDRATYIEVTEEDDVGSVQEMITMEYDQIPIFEDRALRFSIRPVYSTVDISISINYRSTSETEAVRWMSGMKTKIARGSDLNLHSAEYSYAIPAGFLQLMKEIYDLREAIAPYGETFEDYLFSRSVNRLSIATDRVGGNGFLIAKEKQSRIQGRFDFSGLPSKPSYEESTGMWVIAFIYKFSFQKPESVFVDYPVMVHNQLLPAKYLEYIEQQEDPFYQAPYNNRTYRALSMFENDNLSNKARKEEPFIRIPEYDDFKAEELLNGTGSVFIALCCVEEDGRTLVDLNDIGDYSIDEDILAHLPTEAPYMNRRFQSFFQVSLYKNGSLTPDETLFITPDLKVRSAQPLSLRDVHHVRLSIYANVSLLNRTAIDRLLQSPKAFFKTLAAVNENLRENPDFIDLGQRDRVEPYELSDLYYYLTGTHYGNQQSTAGSPAPTGWHGAAGWPGIENKSFLDCVDPVMIRNHYRTKEPDYYRAVTNNALPTSRTDEIFIKRFYQEKRRRRPEKNCSNVPYVTTIDHARVNDFLSSKVRQRVTVMMTGIIARPKSHLKGD